MIRSDSTVAEFARWMEELVKPMTTLEAIVTASRLHENDPVAYLGTIKIINRSILPLVSDEIVQQIQITQAELAERKEQPEVALREAQAAANASASTRGRGFVHPAPVPSHYAAGNDQAEYHRDSFGGEGWRDSHGTYHNELPKETFVDGPYGGSYETNHWYERDGKAYRAKSALDSEYQGQDPWAHG